MNDPETPIMAAIHPPSTKYVLIALAWLAVAVPLLWGVVQTIKKASALFR